MECGDDVGGIDDISVLTSTKPGAVCISRGLNRRPRFLVIGTDGQKPDVGSSVSREYYSKYRIFVPIWGASARKIDDQEAPAMLIMK